MLTTPSLKFKLVYEETIFFIDDAAGALTGFPHRSLILATANSVSELSILVSYGTFYIV